MSDEWMRENNKKWAELQRENEERHREHMDRVSKDTEERVLAQARLAYRARMIEETGEDPGP